MLSRLFWDFYWSHLTHHFLKLDFYSLTHVTLCDPFNFPHLSSFLTTNRSLEDLDTS